MAEKAALLQAEVPVGVELPQSVMPPIVLPDEGEYSAPPAETAE